MQGVVREGSLLLCNVGGSNNPADALTNPMGMEDLAILLRPVGVSLLEGVAGAGKGMHE